MISRRTKFGVYDRRVKSEENIIHENLIMMRKTLRISNDNSEY